MPALLNSHVARPAGSRSSSRSHCGASPDAQGMALPDELNLALWERDLPRAVARLCVSWAQLPGWHEVDVTAAAGRGLESKLAASALFARDATNPPRRWLLEDILQLARLFSDLASADEVRVRLSRMADDGCAAFHIDTLPI